MNTIIYRLGIKMAYWALDRELDSRPATKWDEYATHELADLEDLL